MTEALAFDLYGTLVDPIRIWQRLEQYVGRAALEVSQLWRQKQLEYTFRLTAMQRYEDFEVVTRKALDYALLVLGHHLSDEQRRTIVAEYDQLQCFPDVRPGLQRLRDAGHTIAVLSNGTPRMQQAVVRSAGIDRFIEQLISVDEVHMYKPAPQVYEHAAARLSRRIEEVCLISANPFDVIGAAAAGMQAAWINRSGGVFDTLGTPPTVVAASLTELADQFAG